MGGFEIVGVLDIRLEENRVGRESVGNGAFGGFCILELKETSSHQ
jgi:hypothetical protein